MAKRISVGFSGHGETIVYSVEEKKFYSYEADGAKLHEKYGGKQYYSSRTGMTGDGFLEPKPGLDDLIVFGTYRTDTGAGHQTRETVATVKGQWGQSVEIFGYAPIASHKGLQFAAGYPLVLTDGRLVAFVNQYDLAWALEHWGSEVAEKAREINLRTYSVYGSRYENSFLLYNEGHFRGVNALRFVDLAGAPQIEREKLNEFFDAVPPHACQALDLVKIRLQAADWLHYNRGLKVFDLHLVQNPLTIVGEIGIDGWVGDGKGFVYRRRGQGIQAFVELSWETLLEAAGEEAGLDLYERPDWLEFEQEFTLFEWYGMSEDQRRAKLLQGLSVKALAIRDNARRRIADEQRRKEGLEGLKRRMTEKPDERVTLEDSYAVGNCKPGTARFIEKFGLKGDEGITFAELLAMEKLDEMLKDASFARTLWYVVDGRPEAERRQRVIATDDDMLYDDFGDEDEDFLGEETLRKLRSGSLKFEEDDED